MAVRPILKMGTPSLFEKSKPWPLNKFGSPELQRLLTDMRETMIAANGAGLAAPQIGENVRVVIFEVGDNPRYPGREKIPFTVLINPVLTPLGAERAEDWEGCLSVPGLRGKVSRFARLRYTGFDAHGKPIDRTVDRFHARVVQHEVDHLDGVLYPMRMSDMTQLGFTEVLFPDLAGVDDD
ncbi:MAG: peptide deformylase [Betaproteobacteria bacterium]|nr:peptide deformylase [Betaproteobacteria bacterium]